MRQAGNEIRALTRTKKSRPKAAKAVGRRVARPRGALFLVVLYFEAGDLEHVVGRVAVN